MKSKYLMLHIRKNRHSRVKNSTLEEKHFSILSQVDKELKEENESKETQDK